MAMQFYIPQEQITRDKAEFARRGIARGRSVVAVCYRDGLLFVAENPSATLYKLGEIYDRIAFAAVGRFSEYEQLRRAGIQYAETQGYQYSRRDVSGRSLANAYANLVGAQFTSGSKPLEVEVFVAEVADDRTVELYHVLYDGSITDERGAVAIGGDADAVNGRLAAFEPDLDLRAALRLAVGALTDGGSVEASRLEVAGLDGTRGRRKFFRLDGARLAALLDGDGTVGNGDGTPDGATSDGATP